MTATPALTPVQKSLVLNGNGGTNVIFGGITKADGTPLDSSTGWTFALKIAPQPNQSGPSNASTLTSSGSTITGATGGAMTLQEPAVGGGGIAGTSPTSLGTYTIQGSTDSFSTQETVAFGSYSFLSLPQVA